MKKQRPKTGKQITTDLVNEDTRRKIFEHRLGGLSLNQLSKAYGLSVQRISTIVNETLQQARHRNHALADEYQSIILARLEHAHSRIWYGARIFEPAIVPGPDGNPVPSPVPDLEAMARFVDIQTKIAKLIGADSPMRVQFDVQMIDDAARTAARIALHHIPPENRAAFLRDLKDAMTRSAIQMGESHGDMPTEAVKTIASKILEDDGE